MSRGLGAPTPSPHADTVCRQGLLSSRRSASSTASGRRGHGSCRTTRCASGAAHTAAGCSPSVVHAIAGTDTAPRSVVSMANGRHGGERLGAIARRRKPATIIAIVSAIGARGRGPWGIRVLLCLTSSSSSSRRPLRCARRRSSRSRSRRRRSSMNNTPSLAARAVGATAHGCNDNFHRGNLALDRRVRSRDRRPTPFVPGDRR